MTRTAHVLGLALLLGSATLTAQRGTSGNDWRTWGGDLGATRYAPLDQIDASNFNSLEISGGIGHAPHPHARHLRRGRTVTLPSGRRGAMLRAYDKATGADRGAVSMPGAQTGSPMTFMLGGKQYIVVAVSSSTMPGELIAYKLP